MHGVTSSIEENLRKSNLTNNLPAGSEDVDKTTRYSYDPSVLVASNTYSFSVSDFWTLSIVRIKLHAPFPCKNVKCYFVLRTYINPVRCALNFERSIVH